MAVIRNIDTKKQFKVGPRWIRIQRMRKRVFAWANALSEYMEERGKTTRLVMITLTYAYNDDWSANHISKFMRGLVDSLGSKLLGYAWVAELQGRGAIHYMVEVLVKRGTKIKMPDKEGLWNYGSTRIETCRTPFYICEYLGKEYQKLGVYPKGARMCGTHIRKGLLSWDDAMRYKLALLPKWLSDRYYLLDGGEFDSWVGRDDHGHWVIDGIRQCTPYMLISLYGEPYQGKYNV